MKNKRQIILPAILLASIFIIIGCSAKKNTNSNLVNLQLNKAAVAAYYADGQYDADVTKISEEADVYLAKTIKSGKYIKPAIIFDIDDTLLNNYPVYKRMGFRFSPSIWKQWVNLGTIPAIIPMQALYAKYIEQVDVFIITGRNVFQKSQTTRNLKSVGYQGWTTIFFKEEWDRKLTAKQYKMRIISQLIEENGYQIIASFGDQESDFGRDISGKEFKLPNFLYITK